MKRNEDAPGVAVKRNPAVSTARSVMATQRLTQLVTQDEITRPLREKVERWADDYPEFSVPERLAYLVTCPACASVYGGTVVLLLEQTRIGRMVNVMLALSGAALAVDAVIELVNRKAEV